MVRLLLASALSVSMMLRDVKLSRPVVGSSRNSTDGSLMSSTPMAARLRSPPEMPRTSALPILVLAHALRFSSVMTSSTRCSFSSFDMEAGNLSRAAYSNDSRTVN
eukprot:Mycagemm_TRINITY_DN10278_c2_g2::TRINITY_DN10278_c2_g2_i1::g.3644::m.3644 type:complete len:106 gc:universal TRINITY_DN10278_c2_g2_i1:1168-1485(+)